MNMQDPMMGHTASASPLHRIILVLLILTAVTYIARTFFFRRQVTRLLGFFDVLGELGHSGCALLMVPMVVPAWMANPQLRFGCALLSLLGGLVFTTEGLLVKSGKLAKYPQYKSWWSFAHGGMYLGMAEMYWVHDHVIINAQITTALTWMAGGFYLWFCAYYSFALVTEAIHTRGRAKWALYLQANTAHLFAIGLPMLGMLLWPEIFMPAGHDHAAMMARQRAQADQPVNEPHHEHHQHHHAP